jgi:transposase
MSHANDTSVFPSCTIGLDLGDRTSAWCAVDAAGTVTTRGTIGTTPAALTALAAQHPGARVILEAGTHSPWVSRQLAAAGHAVVVANPSKCYQGRRRQRNDRRDAEFLARQGRADVTLLHPITHRRPHTDAPLALLRARAQVVAMRTQAITTVRGLVKPSGARLPACSAESFPRQAAPHLPAALRGILEPLLTLCAQLTAQIRAYDRQLAHQVLPQYPIAQRFATELAGVGPLTALAVVLLIDDPARFRHSRDVGAYFGLVPKLDESGDATPQLRITKAGDALGRKLLVSAAHYILHRGPDTALRRHGEQLMQRGGANARKRAVIAVARKLVVLLHRLWVTGAAYDPTRGLPAAA